MIFVKELIDVLKPAPNKYKFLGIEYNTFEEMNAAVKFACDKLAKTIIK